MSNVKIIIFDEEELTATLVQNYAKELTFDYTISRFNEFNEEFINNSSDSNIIIININMANAELLTAISNLSKKKNNNFIIITQDNSTDLHVKALRAGAKDFLLKPLVKSDFIYSLHKIYQKEIMTEQNNTSVQVYSTVSFEDNAGKTVFLINLAKEIADINKDNVLLIDLNNSLNDISFLLDVNINNYNTSYFVKSLTTENASELVQKIPKYHNSSLHVLGNGFRSIKNVEINAGNIQAMIGILKNYFKYILIDCNEDNENVHKTVLALSDVTYYIVTPKISNTEKVKNFARFIANGHDSKLILNKCAKRDEQSIQRLEATIGKDIYMKIPQNFMAIGESTNKGITIKEINPNLDVAQVFTELAKKAVNRE